MRINEKVICAFELFEDTHQNISPKQLQIILSVIFKNIINFKYINLDVSMLKVQNNIEII